MRERLRPVIGAALAPVRSRGRKVAWTPAYMNVGNHLFLWWWAWLGSAAGERRYVLRTPAMDPWLLAFPLLADLTVSRSEVRLSDDRVRPWTSAEPAERYRMPGSTADLDRFLDERLLPSPALREVAARVGAAEYDDQALVVNVRRGDYFSDPEHLREFGIDTAGYTRAAVELSVARDGPPSSIRVVSDDPDWCRRELGFLETYAPLAYAAKADSALQNLLDLAGAGRLVIPNSTFSYWGGYLSGAIHQRHGQPNHARIWAPRFFDRLHHGGRAWNLDPRWSVVEDIPGGWDSILHNGPAGAAGS